MCRLSSSDYERLYQRSAANAGRSLLRWLRDLWRPRPAEAKAAELDPFPVAAVERPGQAAERPRRVAA